MCSPSRCFLAGLLVAFSMACPNRGLAQAPASGSIHALESSIARSSWHDAMRDYAAVPAQATISPLLRLAQGNVVMAQWFLADALARQGRRAEAAKWLYVASLGTRMDASLCRMQDAKLVESRFVTAFAKDFSPLRRDDRLRREGISQAILWHKPRMGQSGNPAWVCQLVAYEQRRVPVQPLHPQRQWEGRRSAVVADYQKQSGMDFTKSPDLIPIRAENGQ